MKPGSWWYSRQVINEIDRWIFDTDLRQLVFCVLNGMTTDEASMAAWANVLQAAKDEQARRIAERDRLDDTPEVGFADD